MCRELSARVQGREEAGKPVSEAGREIAEAAKKCVKFSSAAHSPYFASLQEGIQKDAERANQVARDEFQGGIEVDLDQPDEGVQYSFRLRREPREREKARERMRSQSLILLISTFKLQKFLDD